MSGFHTLITDEPVTCVGFLLRKANHDVAVRLWYTKVGHSSALSWTVTMHCARTTLYGCGQQRHTRPSGAHGVSWCHRLSAFFCTWRTSPGSSAISHGYARRRSHVSTQYSKSCQIRKAYRVLWRTDLSQRIRVFACLAAPCLGKPPCLLHVLRCNDLKPMLQADLFDAFC